VTQAGEKWWLIALAVEGVGVLWGVGVFRLVDGLQQRFLEGALPRLEGRIYDRLTLLSTGLSLLGATAGAVLAIPRWGLGVGFGIAIAATGAVGLMVLGFLVANSSSDESPA
jgi:hypothetical protein